MPHIIIFIIMAVTVICIAFSPFLFCRFLQQIAEILYVRLIIVKDFIAPAARTSCPG